MKTRNSLSLLTGLVATGAVVALSQAPVQAASFSANDASDRAQCPTGSTTCYIDGFFELTASPEGDQITQKQVNSVWGFGIADNGRRPSSDPSRGEIDPGERLDIAFRNESGKSFKGILEYLDLSFMYRPGVFNDQVFEMALVSTDGKSKTGTLQVKNATTAEWRIGNAVIAGAVELLSPSNGNGGGSYRIKNPFQDFVMNGFSVTAVPVLAGNAGSGANFCVQGEGNCPLGSRNSDFALTAVSVKRVPEPATLLGLGAVGLLAFAQRRRSLKTN